jgi:hypothetical protein
MTKNLYIIQDVLWDYTDGMVVIIASNLDECRSLFIDEFVCGACSDSRIEEYDASIAKNEYKVIPVSVNEESRVVSYVYGGA